MKDLKLVLDKSFLVTYSLEEKFSRFFYSDDVRMFDLVIRFKSLRERGTGDRF